MIDIGLALKQAQIQLKASINKLDALLEAEILLCHVLAKNRAYLFAHPEVVLTPNQFDAYQHLIQQRCQGIPIAYIIGTREFWSLNLKVNEHTLIPRHETERLIELALELIPFDIQAPVLDLGTGSGTIALALAKERPHWNIIACDFSQEALVIAKENAKTHNIANVSFYHSDWFNDLPKQHYQAILSNPPYIAETDPHLQQGDLRFEPLHALTSSQEGLADLQYIIKYSYNYLLPDGWLLVEHGHDQKTAVNAILNNSGYIDTHCWQDIQGHDRVSGGKHPRT